MKFCAFLSLRLEQEVRKVKGKTKWAGKVLAVFLAFVVAAGCICTGCGSGGSAESSSSSGSSKGTILGSGSKELKILSGSENKELEPILEDYANKNHIRIEMTYQGSLDIMRDLEAETFAYDAVWPASSIWLDAGDEKLHRVKHAESISINPVVFGIKKSLAEKLGFVGKEVSVSDILNAITSGQLKFCMTSATQSNSGASAYLGFIHALLGDPDVIRSDDLKSEDLKKNLTELLSGINRSSGSSEWLMDMFVKSDYDAMVNYECLMIAANKELEKAGKEPLYVVYPYDGLCIADSPLAYVDQGDKDKEKLFTDLQDYLLTSDVQNEIQKTGRRTAYTGINEENKAIFKTDWGLQPDRVLSPFKMPDTDVLMDCLNMYQSELRKPSLTVYCLDYSGSMAGKGNKQLVAAMEQLLIQKKARENYLQASDSDVTILIPFDEKVMDTYTAVGNGQDLENLYLDVRNTDPTGGTDMYAAIEEGLQLLKGYDLTKYTTAVIVMTDGMSMDNYEEFADIYQSEGGDIPVFSIMYGDADSSQLDQLASLTNARVFDGRDDLTSAFRKVRGYN